MRMSLDVVLAGSLLVFAAVVSVVVILPGLTISDKPSEDYRPRTELENAGRDVYVANGCTYCHSQYVRWIDWGLGAERIALSGDYIAEQPHLLGSERTGPDLSQAGGEHPDDWHVAHFFNPRHTRPESIMPPFAFLESNRLEALIAYMQSLGFKYADARMERQRKWKKPAVEAFEAGTEANIEWLHEPSARALARTAESVPHDESRPGERQEDLSGLLHRLPRRSGRRNGPRGRKTLSAPVKLHDPHRQGGDGRNSLLPDHERDHGYGHALLQTGAGK